MVTRCAGSERGERRHNHQDCLPYLGENLASMSFSRAVPGTVKGITESVAPDSSLISRSF